jgi:uncharacterized membrane protein
MAGIPWWFWLIVAVTGAYGAIVTFVVVLMTLAASEAYRRERVLDAKLRMAERRLGGWLNVN